MTQATENATQGGATIFNQLAPFDHEELVFCNDNATGLKAIIYQILNRKPYFFLPY